MLKLIVFVFVGESLLSRIQGNSDGPKYEKIPAKTLVFKTQKVDSTGYYSIEDPFPDLISKLRCFMGGYGVPVVGCQEPLVVRMP